MPYPLSVCGPGTSAILRAIAKPLWDRSDPCYRWLRNLNPEANVKRIAVVLIIIVLMALSFAAVGWAILYATGTSVEQIRGALSGEQLAPEMLRGDKDAAQILEQQTSELSSTLDRTKRAVEALRQLASALSGAVPGPDGRADDSAMDKAGDLLSSLDARAGADLIRALDPNLAASLLRRVKISHSAEILLQLRDPKRRDAIQEAMANE